MMMQKAAILALIYCLFWTHSADAVYRCNGRVQQFPCRNQQQTERLERTVVGSVSAASSRSLNQSNQYAKVVTSAFEYLHSSEGIWRGRVAGNGLVYLHLQIKKNGILQSTRYMGKVGLADRTTTFAFRSVAPRGENWTWNIVASNG